jgi:hypothetical protein
VSQISDISPVGTIAYLYEEESLLVRVRKGWQYISVSLSLSGPARNKMRSTFTVDVDRIYRCLDAKFLF